MQQIREKNIFTRWKYLLLLNFLFLFIVTSGYARDVTLQWDPNSEPDLAGYRLFYCEEGQSYDYFNSSWEGTNTTCTIYDLEENKTCYCVVRAFDTEGLESGNSNEVCLEPTIPDNQQPIAYIGLDPTSGIAPLTVNFDGSGSYDPDGEIVSYDWDFGDGTTAWGETVSHTFNYPGVYTVTLTVIDDQGSTGSDTIEINAGSGFTNQSPVAVVSSDSTSGVAPLTVNFDGSGSYDPDGKIVSYDWDFGDGTTAWGETVSHTFNDPGVYTVTVTVTDNNDLTASDQITITVDEGGSVSPNQAPVIDAGSDDLIILPVDTVTLDGTVTDDGLPSGVLTTVWSQISGPANQVEFYDADAIQTTARFLSAGTYVLELTADDGELTAGDQITITVDEGGNIFTSEVQVASGSDDAEENASGYVSSRSNDLELVYSRGNQTVGIRFNSVDVPHDATIVNAYVQFMVDETDSEATSLTIEGEDIDNAATFISSRSNISSRARTSANMSWSPAVWTTVGEAGSDQRTPDVSRIIQEIIDRPGWSSGNSLVAIITGTGKRVAESYNGNRSGAPMLHVEYATGSASNQAAVVDAGTDDLIILPIDTVTLDGTVTDDGLPTGVLTTVWSQISGPANQVVFDNAYAIQTTARFLSAGTYVLQLTADDGELTAGDQVTITVTPAGTTAQLESGAVTVDGDYVTVNLANTYVSPVVVCSVKYNNNNTPVVARVNNVISMSFDVRLQNPSGGAVETDTVNYLVVEEGIWNINGVNIEAQTYMSTVTDENNSWVGEAQSFGQRYTSPVVLGQVMSENDPDWSVFWCQGSSRTNPPSANALRTGKTVGEDTDTTRADETIGFIVFEAGHGTIGGVEFEASLGTDSVKGVTNSPPYTYSFDTAFGSVPQVTLGSMAGMDGNNGGWAYMHGSMPASNTSLYLSLDEDQIGDSERSHTSEQIGYVVFETPVAYQ